MSSPSIINCLPSTVGIHAACTKPEEEGAVGGGGGEGTDEGNDPKMANGGLNGLVTIKTDHEDTSTPTTSPQSHSPPQPLSPRLGPLANIDEDEHENDLEYTKDDYCGTTSNTATLLLKDRKMNKVGFVLNVKINSKDTLIDD